MLVPTCYFASFLFFDHDLCSADPMAGLLPLIATAHYTLFTLFLKIPMNMFMEIGAQEGGCQAVKQGRRWRGEKSMVTGALNSTTKS